MARNIQVAIMSTLFALAVPLAAQRGQGAGVGRAAGPVTAPVTSAAHGAASAASGKSGNAADHSANAGHGAGASADVGAQVTRNTGLSTQLQPLLPQGMTLANAAAGFRNQGQFVAALHVSHNLNIPFDQLKAKMTGPDSVPLGKAIQELRPSLDSKSVKDNTNLAEHQAERDLQRSKSAGKPDGFAARISSNTALAARLQALLPQGMTLESAAAGFKNEGQFIAALEASKNLNLSFADLKDRMTAGQSLGQAIHALKPGLSEDASETEAAHAEQQAKVARTGTSE